MRFVSDTGTIYHHGTLLLTHPDTGTKVDKGLERSRKQRIDAITWEHEGKIYNPESIIDRDNFGWFSKHVMIHELASSGSNKQASAPSPTARERESGGARRVSESDRQRLQQAPRE